MDRIPISKYPYTDFHEINLDWVIERIQEMYSIIDQKIADALEPVNTDIAAIKARLDTVETDITGLNETVSNHTGQIEQISTSIQNIGNTVGQILGDVSALNTAVDDINENITSINATLSVHTDDIADIYDKISGLDPAGSLYVDATNFDTIERSVSRLEDILQFEIEGGNSTDRIYMQPDLIPGTQTGYYPRVTMTFNPETDKIELPAELTTGDYPLILRGTYATNVDVNAELYIGDPLEYSISGAEFNIEGRDQNAIILMCLWSAHHNSAGYENEFNQTPGRTFLSMPYDNFGDVTTSWIQYNQQLFGLNLWVYCFNKSGDLLSYQDITNIDYQNTFNIPADTYSIWLGFYAPNYLARENINGLSLGYNGLAGCLEITSNGPVTEHIVKFESEDDTQYYIASVSGIKGLDYPNNKIDMFTGDVYSSGYYQYTCSLNMSFNDLDPETNYTPSLPYKSAGYREANIKYNKVSLLINGLDANNVRY